MFRGSYTALITPFKEGKFDSESFESLIERQIEAGTDGLVPSGTTGESPTLDHLEHNDVIECCVKAASGRAKILAGTGSNSTAEAIMVTRHAQKSGADGALIMTPYYNKPTQEGLYRHFHAIHEATDIPIILYNIPGRCVVDIEDDTIARLAELPRVVGLKDATGDLSRVTSLKKKGLKEDFCLLSGEDDTAVEFNELGGNGCISVTANIAPALCAEMQQACLDGDFKKAEDIQEKLMPLHEVMFCETSPQPVKYALSLMGLCMGDMRLPLISPSDANQEIIKNALESAGLI